MTIRQTRNGNLKTEERVLEDHREWLMTSFKDDVVAVGTGFRKRRGKFTDEKVIVVAVKRKRKNVTKRKKIPAKIGGIPVDVVQHTIPIVPESTDISRQVAAAMVEQVARSVYRIRNQTYDPLLSGVPIRNMTNDNGLAALGAIVFDEFTGEPYGLSVQHGIGKRAKRGDLIAQGVSDNGNGRARNGKPDQKLKIGSLIHFDEDMDAAIFKLDTDRKILPQVRGVVGGIDKDIPLGDPVEPVRGMKVECFGRRNYAVGEVKNVLKYRVKGMPSMHYRWVEIQLDDNSITQGGDSGSLWVKKGTQHPIGIHLGSDPNNSKIDYVASVVDLSTRWSQSSPRIKFNFSPPDKSRFLPDLLKDFETSFVERGSNLFALCHKNGMELEVRRFDKKFEKVPKRFICKGLKPSSSVAIADHKPRGSQSPSIHGFWRNHNHRILHGVLPQGSARVREIGALPRIKSQYKPAAISHNGKIILAYQDVATLKLHIATSSTGKTWKVFKTSHFLNRAPALAIFQDKPVVSWVAPSPGGSFVEPVIKGQVKASFLKFKNRQMALSRAVAVTPHNATGYDPSMCVYNDRLYLAYTNAGDQVQILEASKLSNFNSFRIVETRSQSSPTIYCFNGEVFCTRKLA